MRLEKIPKYFSPKSPKLSDEPPATKTDSLSITDVMAAIGMSHQEAGVGLDLFLAKIGVSTPDKAINGLMEIAQSLAGQCKPIAELDVNIKRDVLQVLATFAYQDYARSPASVRRCDCCNGTGFTDAEVFTMKSSRNVREQVRLLCRECKGKGVVSNSCRCHGKGVVVDEEKTQLNGGIPAFKQCDRCGGRGYSKLKFSAVVAGINCVHTISKTTAYNSIKPFFDVLVSECYKQEGITDSVLRKVTN